MNCCEVRELQADDVSGFTNYWMTRTDEQLLKMGVDRKKLQGVDLRRFVKDSLACPLYEKKTSYCVLWLVDGFPVGHSNINKINYGKEAYMHLHMWNAENRAKGFGKELVFKSLYYYFNNFKLEKVYCEPNAYNEAPNKTLPKVGFVFKEKLENVIPGFINFEQDINVWEITKENYEKLSGFKLEY
jgi:RimJ/RimL family protein N-acetyltransferase